MYNDSAQFVRWWALGCRVNVACGNGVIADIIYQGTVHLYNRTDMVSLTNVLYVPTLKLSLFSATAVVKSGAVVRFTADVGAVVYKMTCYCLNSIFVLICNGCVVPLCAQVQWQK